MTEFWFAHRELIVWAAIGLSLLVVVTASSFWLAACGLALSLLNIVSMLMILGEKDQA